jgi:hypothetical protein
MKLKMIQQHRGWRFGHALSQLMPNTNFPLYCSLHQTLAPLTQIVTTGINNWHNTDSLAVTEVLVAATVEAVIALMAAATVVGVVVMIVVVPAGAVPVELSLHSQVLTYLHIFFFITSVNKF